MSWWTEVDVEFTVNKRLSVTQMEELVGVPVSWRLSSVIEERKDTHDFRNGFLPTGSEQTPDIYIEKITKHKTVFRVAGNLRDVYSTKGIVDWFNNTLSNYTEYGVCRNKVKIYKAFGYCKVDYEQEPTWLYYKAESK